MKNKIGRIAWRLAQVVIIGFIFYFLGKQLYTNWDGVKSYQWELNYYYLALSVVSIMITFVTFSSVWKFIVISLGKDVSFARAFKIAYLANLGRYIPGKVWQMFGIIYLAKKEGITEEESITTFGISQMFAIPSSLLAGLLLLAMDNRTIASFSGHTYYTVLIIVFGVAVAALSVFVVYFPRPVEKIINHVFTFIKRKPIQLHINKSLATIIFSGYFLAWCLYGFSFWIFLNGIVATPAPLFPMTGIFIIAYQIGYLTLFAPGGLGPREGVMAVLLTPFFGPAAVAIPIAARIWLMIAEAISALIAITIK